MLATRAPMLEESPANSASSGTRAPKTTACPFFAQARARPAPMCPFPRIAIFMGVPSGSSRERRVRGGHVKLELDAPMARVSTRELRFERLATEPFVERSSEVAQVCALREEHVGVRLGAMAREDADPRAGVHGDHAVQKAQPRVERLAVDADAGPRMHVVVCE